MRLTLAVFRYYTEHNLKRIPGKLFSGKYRLSQVVSNKMKMQAVKDVLREQRNMAFLSRPYLTKEEDPHGAEPFKPTEADKIYTCQKMAEAKRDSLTGVDGTMQPHTHAEEFYSHIKHSRAWE